MRRVPALGVTVSLVLAALPALGQAPESQRRFAIREERERMVPGQEFVLRGLPQPRGAPGASRVALGVTVPVSWRDADGDHTEARFRFLFLRFSVSGGPNGDVLTLDVPPWDALQASLAIPFRQDLFQAHDAALCIYGDSPQGPPIPPDGWVPVAPSDRPCEVVGRTWMPGDPHETRPLGDVAVEVSDPRHALGWSLVLLAVACALVFFLLFRRKGSPDWNPFRVLASLLVEGDAFSLSRLQVLAWTVVVAFGLIYVWKMTEQFLEVSTTVLVLLGIGGGTAAVRRISLAVANLPARKDRLPRWHDLACSEGNPDVARLQVLVFTVLIAGTVFREILEHYRFPDLGEGLVSLMGVSSSVYLATEVVRDQRAKQEAEKKGEKTPVQNPDQTGGPGKGSDR
jgi:hypothetical protein